jgi:hypothetical protein
MTRLAWFVVPGLLLGAAACTKNDETVFPLSALALKDTGGFCTTDTPGPAATFTSMGILDVGHIPGTPYLFAPDLGNGTAASTEMPDAHIAYVQGVDTEIIPVNDPASQALVNALDAAGYKLRTQHFSVAIPPAGFSGPIFTLIDGDQSIAILAALRNAINPVQIIVRMQPYGVIDDGPFSGVPFTFPITVCNGCLFEDLGDCTQYPMDFTGSPGGACNALQDAVLQCCEDKVHNLLVCPAKGSMPTMMN